MNETIDRTFGDWLREGPEDGPGDGLERALAATRRTGQRPGWTFVDRWLPMQLTSHPVFATRLLIYVVALALLAGALVGAALLAGSQHRLPAPLPQLGVNNDPIPLTPKQSDSLDRNVRGWGYRLETVTSMDPPRISARQATMTAGNAMLKGLKDNSVPAQDVTVPDGLIRRTYVDPSKGVRADVWVVLYVWRAGFDCTSESGGPGPCQPWDAYFVDDQTGELINGVGLMEP
jgi:hypothetical protein